MRASSIISLLLIIFANNFQAQSTYEKIYLTGGYGHLLELSSQNVLTGYCYSNSTNMTGTTLIDINGNILYSQCRAIDTMLVLIGLAKYSDNEFFFTSAYYKDTCTVNGPTVIKKIHPVIGKIDSSGNILSSHYYSVNSSTCTNLVGDLEIIENKSVIAWGNSFAMKVDSMGSPIWSKQIGNGHFRFIRELPSGDLLAGINIETAGAVIARMDADGNFLWVKSYVRPKGMVHDVVIESDSCFIISGITDSTNVSVLVPLPPNFNPKLFMMKLNGSGDVQWCKGYDSAPHNWYTPNSSRLVKALDGNYTILSTLGQSGYNFFYRPFLMKTDLNGDTLWTRSVGSSEYDYYTQDLLACLDGGYMISGIVWGSLPAGWTGAPYIFKTDSLGHLPCLERKHPIQVLDLFPTDSSFTLTSVDGATVHPAFVSDTVFDPIAVYDGCIWTSVPDPRRTQKFKVRPNPNLGQFTVEFEDPLQADSFYSVYDAMGRLLYQRPLPTGKESEEIDLSRFGKGVYLLQFTDEDEVRTERVVVE